MKCEEHGRENCHIWVAGMYLPKAFAQPEDIIHVDITSTAVGHEPNTVMSPIVFVDALVR
jgi:hypothetical protein